VLAFDDLSLDIGRRELRRGSLVIAVEPKTFDILAYLIAHRSRVVAKEELLGAVWPGRVISDSTLSSQIAGLRRAIGDTGEAQRLVRTVARKGFRFVGAIQEASPDAAPTPASLAPERRPLTVVCCRVTLPSGLDPEQCADTIARSRSAIDAAAAKAGAWVVTHTTEGAIVAFGYPEAREDDAERAVRLGRQIVLSFAEPGNDRHALRTQVGIATGMFVVGERDRTGPDAPIALAGESLHVALRLMERADADAVSIAESTRRAVGRLFDLHPAPADAAAAPNDALPRGWTVSGEGGNANRFQALRSVDGPLIGRDEEIAMLLRRWQQIKSGEGRVVLICGEPGIGKSRLVAEFAATLCDDRPALLSFFCAPDRTGTALFPVIAHIEEAAGLEGGDTAEARRRKLARWLDAGVDTVEARDVDLFGELLSPSTPDERVALSLSARARKERVLERFVAHVAGRSHCAPAVIVVEDAHWIDPTTRDLFDLLIERVRSLPALVVLTHRPEFVPACIGQSHVTALMLNRLGRRDNSALVDRVAGGKRLPPALLERIVASSDGVPLFVEEVTKAILESGVVHDTGDSYEIVGELSGFVVPPTLQASLVARLDRLAPARAVVQTCAAIGRQFDFRVLRAVTGAGDDALAPVLAQLVASGLVQQRGAPPDATYAFKHALVQDAAYDTMLKAQRIRVHRRIADVLEAEFPEMPARHPEVLAHHCVEAGLWARAIDWSIAAARMALERSAGIEARRRVEGAIGLLERVGPGRAREQLEGRLQVALADALIMTDGFAAPAVMAALQRARTILDERTHPDDALRALCGLYNYHLIRSESPRCLELTAAMLERARDVPARTIAHYLRGTANLHLGNFGATIRHLEAARDAYDEDACRAIAFVAGYHVRSFTLIWLSLAYLYVGESDLATATIRDAVADARGRRHPFTLVSALLAQSRFCSHRGDFAAARDAADEGLAIAMEQRSPYHVSRANILRAINRVDAGDAAGGIALLEQSLVAHHATGADFQSGYNLSRLAEAHAGAGNLQRALELARASIVDVERSGERWWEAEAHRIHGELLLRGPRPARAEAMRSFDRALAVARQQGARLWEANALRSRSLAVPRRRAAARDGNGNGNRNRNGNDSGNGD